MPHKKLSLYTEFKTMKRTRQSIPVNHFSDEHNSGILIEKISFNELPEFDEWGQSERHDRHSFFLMETGTISIQIDFQTHTIGPASIIYMHPNQVHRIMAFENVTVNSLAIDNENLNPEYLTVLEEITPTIPFTLAKEAFSIISEAASLCLKISGQRNTKLYQPLLKDSCNALVALIISQFLQQSKSAERPSRFEIITKAFKQILEHNYTIIKRPAAYAQQLNISTPYLNECVRNTTGYSVTYHIQQRVVLEAKRLLYHSDKSVKEIATELGYDDYPYFSRLFTKVASIPAQAFRNKNFD